MIKLTEQTLFADRYLFKRLLGRGGFSEVWLATDKMTGLDIAVKVYAPGQGMDTDGMTDFCKELSNVYNLNHTNLLKPQHVDNWEGMPYLVMTYCQKGSCHRLIGTMTETQIWKVLHDVSAGLAYLHEQGLIHQDIKPDNILIDNAGHYVITDFGISVRSRSTLRKSMNISTGNSGGTTAYMGPERFSADPTPLKSSDIWSLGATLYELITGNAPFGEIGGGLQKNGADLPTIKQNISSELRTVLAKMLSKETWDRPTAEQLEHWGETRSLSSDIVSYSKSQFYETSSEASKDTNLNSTQNFQKPSNKDKKSSTQFLKIWFCIGAGCLFILGGFLFWNKVIYVPLRDNVRKERKETTLEIDSLCRSIVQDKEYVVRCDEISKILSTLNNLDSIELKDHDEVFPKLKKVNYCYNDYYNTVKGCLEEVAANSNTYLDSMSKRHIDTTLNDKSIIMARRTRYVVNSLYEEMKTETKRAIELIQHFNTQIKEFDERMELEKQQKKQKQSEESN